MNERANKGERNDHATVIFDLIIECRDKVSNDCLEPTLILSDAIARQYAREIEKTAWTSRKGLEGYRQVTSDLIVRIKEIRDGLPTDWQDFSNWLRECTGYSQTTTPNVSTARPLPPQPRPAVQVVPLHSEPVSYAVSSTTKTLSFETACENIDPALLAIDAANEKDAMEIETDTAFASVQNGESQVSSANANTVPSIKKVASEIVTTESSLVSQAGNPNNDTSSAVSGNSQGDVVMDSVPTASDSAAKDSLERSSTPSSSASSPGSSPSKTDPIVSSTNDDTLQMILSLLKEESAGRVEAEAKRADAEMKQKQSQEEVLQRIASLEKSHSSMKEAMTDKQKQLDEREAAVSKREAVVKALQAKLEADSSRQAAAEKAQLEKEKALSQLQAKADRRLKEAEARLATIMTPVMSAAKQEEPVKHKVLASTSNANDKVISEAKKVARPKRKPSQIVKILDKAFPPEKAVIAFHELKHGVLRMSKVGKAQPKDVEAQVDKVLRLNGRRTLKREQHVSMLIDLINFENTIGRNDDEPYCLLNATVKDAVIEFANEGLTKWLFCNNNWLNLRKVSEQHKNMQAIKTIARLGTCIFDMNLALSSAEEPDEFDDEDTSATPSDILERYFMTFSKYDSALQRFLGAVPELSPTYEPVKAHREREGLAMCDAWAKAVSKFDDRI